MSKTRNGVSREARDRAVRLVLDQEAEPSSRSSAFQAIAPKIGCSAHTLNASRSDGRGASIKKAEIDAGRRGGVPTELAEKASPSRHRSERRWRAALERENRELRQANEILRHLQRLSCPPLGACGQSPAGQRDGARPPVPT